MQFRCFGGCPTVFRIKTPDDKDEIAEALEQHIWDYHRDELYDELSELRSSLFSLVEKETP